MVASRTLGRARLTTRGYLHRRNHPRHGHVLEIHLTDTGLDVLQRADTHIAHLEVAAADILGTDTASVLTQALDSSSGGSRLTATCVLLLQERCSAKADPQSAQ